MTADLTDHEECIYDISAEKSGDQKDGGAIAGNMHTKKKKALGGVSGTTRCGRSC